MMTWLLVVSCVDVEDDGKISHAALPSLLLHVPNFIGNIKIIIININKHLKKEIEMENKQKVKCINRGENDTPLFKY